MKLSEKRKLMIRAAYFSPENLGSASLAYQDMCGQLNMFGYAFHGWYCTSYQKSLLNSVWMEICKLEVMYNKDLTIQYKKQLMDKIKGK